MATIDLGKISFTQKGTWASGTAYTAKDVVQHTDNNETSSYVAIASSTGQAPSTNGTVNTSNWAIFAKGSTVASNYQSSAWASGTTYTKGDIVQHTDGDTTSSFIYTNSTPASGQSPSTGGTVNTSYWALLAKGQPQTFNSTNLTNDISTLAIRQATQENKGAYNTNSMYVDVFQDSTGITALTNTVRDGTEFVATKGADTGGIISSTKFFVDGVDSTNPFTDLIGGATGSTNDLSSTSGTPVRSTSTAKWGSNAVIDAADGTIHYGTLANVDWGNAWTIEYWFKNHSSPSNRDRHFSVGNNGNDPHLTWGFDYGGSADINFYNNATNIDPGGTLNYANTNTNWRHFAFQKHTDGSNGDYSYYVDGTRIVESSHSTFGNIANERFRISGRPTGSGTQGGEYITGYYTDILIHQERRYTGSSYTLPSVKAALGQYGANATGSFTSNNITAPSSITKMGAIVSYEDASGTNALNTDIVLKLSADGGSNFATATLTALPNYSSSIKMAKVNDVSVTAGTNLKYKIEFANQSAGSKVAKIRGVSLMY